jgi:large subunit ribosomal protein L4
MASALTNSTIVPLITSRNLYKLSPLQKPLQAWVETLNQVEDKKVGLVDLHPRIFNVNPRLDILARNVYWQQLYGKIVRNESLFYFIFCSSQIVYSF